MSDELDPYEPSTWAAEDARRERELHAADPPRNGVDVAYHPDDPGPADPDEPQIPVYVDRVLNRSALKSLPDPEPLIDNTLDRGTVCLLYGPWGTYKTFIGLDWGASVATGRRWQGRYTEQTRVLYVAGEGAFGLKGRVAAWEIGWHTTIADGQFDVLPTPVNLIRPMDVNNLKALIEWNGYGFVILDTLARCMVGADENSAKDCGTVVDNLVQLRDRTPGGRGVILGVHHAGKDGKTLRGSSAFEAAADIVYCTTKDGAVTVLDREKRKDGPELDRHELAIDLIEGTGSATIRVHREQPGQRTQSADKLMAIFLEHFAQTGATKADLRTVADMASATFHRAVGELLQSGQIVNVGTEKRPFYRVSTK